MQFVWGIGGILVILGIAFFCSYNKKAINWRTVLGALTIQILFGIAVLYWDVGFKVLRGIAMGVQKIISASEAGIGFMFGELLEIENIGFVFTFQVLPLLVFFASLISVLYYLGIMQWFVHILGGGISKLLGTSKAESMSAAANIFVGQTEAPLVIRPYLEKMTRSEFFAVMTGGLTTVAGTVLPGYALLGIPLEYLIAASFMAFPAGLLMAKIIMPETEEIKEPDKVSLTDSNKPQNVIDAASKGATDGMKLALNVAAMLIAFISLIALVNIILGSLGGWFGFHHITLEQIFGYLLAPLAIVMGIPIEEALIAGSYLGQKIILNEFVAYVSLAGDIHDLSPKSVAVLSFALCGFSNFGALAILIGGLGSLVPQRRAEISKYGLMAMLAAALANFLNATIAGMLF